MATNQHNRFEERRLALDAKLRELLGNDNTYFQPPNSIRLKYPCIIYDLDGEDVKHADNLAYLFGRRFNIIHIHYDPDVDVMNEIRTGFTYCKFDRRYISDNLYHDVYTIYFK